MYDPESVNDIANFIIIIPTVLFLLSTISYGTLAPWYRSLLGIAIFGLLASITSVLVFVFTRRLWGDYPGYEWLAVSIYSIFSLFALTFLVVFFVERRRAPLLELSLNRRK